jgi:chromosome segregation ATPase
METARDKIALELKRVTSSLDQVDVQRDDIQSVLDNQTIELNNYRINTKALKKELARCNTNMIEMTSKYNDALVLIEKKSSEMNHLRNTVETLMDEKNNYSNISRLQKTESESLRKDLKAMTMENQTVSSEAANYERERNALLIRIDGLTSQLTNSMNDLATCKRDSEDLLTTYRMVISERATLEHTVSQLGSQRDVLINENNKKSDENIFLRKQLQLSVKELNKYQIDLNEKERVTSEYIEKNNYLLNKLNISDTHVINNTHQMNDARNATAAMAADAETLRYDNARLLQLADAARIRIEELEHRLRVAEGKNDVIR